MASIGRQNPLVRRVRVENIPAFPHATGKARACMIGLDCRFRRAFFASINAIGNARFPVRIIVSVVLMPRLSLLVIFHTQMTGRMTIDALAYIMRLSIAESFAKVVSYAAGAAKRIDASRTCAKRQPWPGLLDCA